MKLTGVPAPTRAAVICAVYAVAFSVGSFLSEREGTAGFAPPVLPASPPAPSGRTVRAVREDGRPAEPFGVGVFDAEYGVVARRRFASRMNDAASFDDFDSDDGVSRFRARMTAVSSGDATEIPRSHRPLDVVIRGADVYGAIRVEPGDSGPFSITLRPDQVLEAAVTKEGDGASLEGALVLFSARAGEGAGRIVERALAIADADGRARLVNPFLDGRRATAAVFPHEETGVPAVSGAPTPVLRSPAHPWRRTVLDDAAPTPVDLEFWGHGLPVDDGAAAISLSALRSASEVVSFRLQDFGGAEPRAFLRKFRANDDPWGMEIALPPDEAVSTGMHWNNRFEAIAPEFVVGRPPRMVVERRASFVGAPDASPSAIERAWFTHPYRRGGFYPGALHADRPLSFSYRALAYYGVSTSLPASVAWATFTAPGPQIGRIPLAFGAPLPLRGLADVVDGEGRARPGRLIRFRGKGDFAAVADDGRFAIAIGGEATLRSGPGGRTAVYADPTRTPSLTAFDVDGDAAAPETPLPEPTTAARLVVR
jgi:hypothetical protein